MSFTSSDTVRPRWGDVYLAAAGRAVSTCGDMVASVTLALALVARGGTGVEVSAIMLAASFPLIALAPVVGRVADRYDSRTILVTTGLVQSAICVALAYAGDVSEMVALVGVLACGVALTGPTLNALVVPMVGKDNLGKAGGINQSAAVLGLMSAPALAGLLYGRFGMHVPLLFDAVTYLAIPLVGLALRTRRGGRFGTSDPRSAPDAGGPLAWRIRDDRMLWPLLLLLTAVLVGLSAVNVVDVFLVRRTLHGSSTMYGLISSGWTVGMLAGTTLMARTKRGDAGLAGALLTMLAGTSTVVLLVGFVPRVAYMLPLWVLGGVINGGENVSAAVLMGRRVPAEFRGRASATFNGLLNGAAAVGMLSGGLLLAVASPRGVFIGCGLTSLALIIAIGLPLTRHLRRSAGAGKTVVAPGSAGSEPADADGPEPVITAPIAPALAATEPVAPGPAATDLVAAGPASSEPATSVPVAPMAATPPGAH